MCSNLELFGTILCVLLTFVMILVKYALIFCEFVLYINVVIMETFWITYLRVFGEF